MPIRKVKGGYKWGGHGHVYASRKGAERQAAAAHAHGFKGEEVITENDEGHSLSQWHARRLRRLVKEAHAALHKVQGHVQEMYQHGTYKGKGMGPASHPGKVIGDLDHAHTVLDAAVSHHPVNESVGTLPPPHRQAAFHHQQFLDHMDAHHNALANGQPHDAAHHLEAAEAHNKEHQRLTGTALKEEELTEGRRKTDAERAAEHEDMANYIAHNHRTAVGFAKDVAHNKGAHDYWMMRAANRAAEYKKHTGKDIGTHQFTGIWKEEALTETLLPNGNILTDTPESHLESAAMHDHARERSERLHAWAVKQGDKNWQAKHQQSIGYHTRAAAAARHVYRLTTGKSGEEYEKANQKAIADRNAYRAAKTNEDAAAIYSDMANDMLKSRVKNYHRDRMKLAMGNYDQPLVDTRKAAILPLPKG